MKNRAFVALVLAGVGPMAIGATGGLRWLTVAAPLSVQAVTTADQPLVSEVAGVAITVGDLDRSIEFYTGVLGCRVTERQERAGEDVERLYGVFGARILTARMALGEEMIELNQFLAPEGRPVPSDARSNDRWFQHVAIVVRDIDKAYARLRAANVRHASSGPQTLPLSNPNAGGISAFYFKDPDGHVLEIIHFPAGKGDPKWQRRGEDLFQGIDHTAIVVGDTDKSLKCYQGMLGLKVVGHSDNSGGEQEHLNNVAGAHLRITALRAEHGPGLEVLEYLSPLNGRAYPADAGDNDLLHYHTIMASRLSPDEVRRALRSSGAELVSQDASGEAPKGTQLRDPDRHEVLVVSGGK